MWSSWTRSWFAVSSRVKMKFGWSLLSSTPLTLVRPLKYISQHVCIIVYMLGLLAWLVFQDLYVILCTGVYLRRIWTNDFRIHIPAANLAVFQKGVWYSGIKIYNHLPPTLKQLSYDISKFKVALKRFLYTNIFTRWRSIIAWNKDLGPYYYILKII